MAIHTVNATIQMRRGLEQDFDADQMTAGEWAVSTDKKYVHMCFSPGIVVRMATYEAFEEDMLEIQKILATCQDIQAAVESFEQLALQHENQAEMFSVLSKSWAVGGTDTRIGEDSDNSKYYSNQSKIHSDISKQYLSKVEQAGNDAVDKINNAINGIGGLPEFAINFDDGHLYYSGTRFAFIVNISTGNLDWGLTV